MPETYWLYAPLVQIQACCKKVMPESTITERWLFCRAPNPTARVKLICLPYAGGGVTPFHAWPNFLPRDVEVSVVHLPGREARYKEPPVAYFDELLQRIYDALSYRLDRPFALFGYSMGALLAFELARRFCRDGGPTVLRLFVAARSAPRASRMEPETFDGYSDEAFLQEIQRRYDAVPAPVLRNPDLRAICLPALRADFRALASYEYKSEPALSCPISAFGGDGDQMVDRVGLDSWREQTNADFALRMFSGGHFFLHTQRELLLSAIAEDLLDGH
jgi:medium-chain acyl-[acyl-carrier-protein] hydrolase